ncbi:hypothetical protein ACG83_11030 [Frankia sp. R43]|uniref:hypothetical protein n=1 Tax=Frankia sp. R43 TaxID=269536 RepID=UPI0006C9EDB6|nr:hypothetical protein [Frankia sp. R43]KPM55798.1 hypothetical protein ACG83_11030 [Frankia sp. R43]
MTDLTRVAHLALDDAVVAAERVQRAYEGKAWGRGSAPDRHDSQVLFALTCRDLVASIDALPPHEQPVGWQIDWETAAHSDAYGDGVSPRGREVP